MMLLFVYRPFLCGLAAGGGATLVKQAEYGFPLGQTAGSLGTGNPGHLLSATENRLIRHGWPEIVRETRYIYNPYTAVSVT